MNTPDGLVRKAKKSITNAVNKQAPTGSFTKAFVVPSATEKKVLTSGKRTGNKEISELSICQDNQNKNCPQHSFEMLT